MCFQKQWFFCKKGVLRNFAKFTRKHLCQGFFFNKVAGRKYRFCRQYVNSISFENVIRQVKLVKCNNSDFF